MLPWFVYLLVQMGVLATEEQWNTLTTDQQEEYEIIINDVPVTEAGSDTYSPVNANPKNLPCSLA